MTDKPLWLDSPWLFESSKMVMSPGSIGPRSESLLTIGPPACQPTAGSHCPTAVWEQALWPAAPN